MEDRPRDAQSQPREDEEPEPTGSVDEAAQAAAAAREAAEIGGPDPDPGIDPAERPVAEGGGGVAEGFEESERALRERASHEERGGDLSTDADPRSESAEATSEYGEADDALSQEERS
jgi:hypothetical protein